MWRSILSLAFGRTFCLALAAIARPAFALPQPPAMPASGCEAAISRAEAAWHLPDGILDAIARVESGRPAPDGTVHPWPWTITADGNGQYLDSAAAAIARVQTLQAGGMRSIDVGCLQINLMHHPEAFASLQEAFDPDRNAGYAAQFLTTLRAQLGSWPAAIGAYHSLTSALAEPYRQRVLAAWHGTPLYAPAPATGGRPFAIGAFHGAARMMPAPQGGSKRDLASYRTTPIRLALRH